LKNEQKRRKAKEELNDFTEEDVTVPLHTLVIDKRTEVKIRNMADYSDVFAAIEEPWWRSGRRRPGSMTGTSFPPIHRFFRISTISLKAPWHQK